MNLEQLILGWMLGVLIASPILAILNLISEFLK